MAQYNSVLSQLLSLIPRDTFNAIVTRHEGVSPVPVLEPARDSFLCPINRRAQSAGPANGRQREPRFDFSSESARRRC
jgi:hypothetical protein